MEIIYNWLIHSRNNCTVWFLYMDLKHHWVLGKSRFIMKPSIIWASIDFKIIIFTAFMIWLTTIFILLFNYSLNQIPCFLWRFKILFYTFGHFFINFTIFLRFLLYVFLLYLRLNSLGALATMQPFNNESSYKYT